MGEVLRNEVLTLLSTLGDCNWHSGSQIGRNSACLVV